MKTIIWTLLAFGWPVSSYTVKEQCTHPVINATKSSLNIYRITDLVDVQIYNCQYLEEETYDLCKNGFHQRKNEILVKNIYNDFTQNCVSAFKKKKYVDRYGFHHDSIKFNTQISYDCYKLDGLQLLIKNISITLKNCTVKADLVRDQVTLRSGTVCRYSSGFCYDPIESVEFMWDIIKRSETAFCSGNFSKVPFNASNSYYLTLDHQKYFVSEVNNEYTAMELQLESQELCGNFWRTNIPGIVISDTVITNATTTSPLTKEDYGIFYFKEKQGLYEFLIDKCNANLSNPSNWDIAYELLKKETAIKKGAVGTQICLRKLEDQGHLLEVLKEEVELLKDQLMTVGCLLGIAILFIIIILIASLYKMQTKCYTMTGMNGVGYKDWVKRFLDKQYEDVKVNMVKDRVNIEQKHRNSDAYETITSEYDFNSIYNEENLKIKSETRVVYI